MNQLQEQITPIKNNLPEPTRKRLEQSEKDVEKGRVTTVTPQELFQELDI